MGFDRMTTRPHIILLVDDHPSFHVALRRMLRRMSPNHHLIVAMDAAAGLSLIAGAAQIDLVLVDRDLPDLDGFNALARFAAIRPETPCVLITARDEPSAARRARRCGAQGYVCKTAPAEQFIAVLAQALENDFDFADDAGARIALAEGVALTQRQVEVLALLGQGKSNKQISNHLAIADRTVRAHLTELFQSLGVQSRTQAVLRAHQEGLIG
jgi:DNA-binding NarL/FixJ family response regulator